MPFDTLVTPRRTDARHGRGKQDARKGKSVVLVEQSEDTTLLHLLKPFDPHS
jgi:hypothetical protein